MRNAGKHIALERGLRDLRLVPATKTRPATRQPLRFPTVRVKAQDYEPIDPTLPASLDYMLRAKPGREARQAGASQEVPRGNETSDSTL